MPIIHVNNENFKEVIEKNDVVILEALEEC